MSHLPSHEQIMTALSEVIDPEVGLNIVEMGLVYEVEMQEDGVAKVEMTLTTPGCPMSSHITMCVREVLEAMPGVNDVDLELVWDPPWTPEKIEPQAMQRLQSGQV